MKKDQGNPMLRSVAFKNLKLPKPVPVEKTPYEHPEDRAMREESERESAQFGDTLASTRIDDLKKLLTTYGDGDAERLLENLREWYWAIALPDAVAAASKGRTP